MNPSLSSKYHAKKTEVDGITFASRKEAQKYCELKVLEKGHIIENLRMQVPYELIPTQRENGKVVERPCKYIADFVYEQDGKTHVVDTKGMRTDAYIIKRKLMLHVHGIRIEEV